MQKPARSKGINVEENTLTSCVFLHYQSENMHTQDFTAQTKQLIDGLKGICANFGLGNDGNEFKIITQAFLYKFMNDKFGYEVKEIEPKLKTAENWEQEIAKYSDEDYEFLLLQMPPESARLQRRHFLSNLHNKQNSEEFAKFFDDTLRDIAITNNDIFSVVTDSGTKIRLFDELSNFITDSSKRDNFCKALVNQMVNFSFEPIFAQKFDFFSTIFEYLIKDYNKDGGGKYAEYYTPHAVAKIMASILVDAPVQNVTCYDPSAGSGTLLMNLAHAIGEDRCTIYSQDISQKSSSMLRLNLILNNLVHSIQNIIQGNTLLAPYHKTGEKLTTFDYIVSNPPFKLDFSDWRDDLDTKQNNERFFAGLPNVPNKDKDKMAIYLLFIQHIIFTLSAKGRAAVVAPTGFLTAQSGIERKIRQKLVDEKMLRGVVSMPSNIFATTGTNVSILFIDKANKKGDIVLMDASKLGTTVKEGKNQKTLLSQAEEQTIIETFNRHESVDDLSVVLSYDEIAVKNYSFSAGQYFEVKIEYTDITPEEFEAKMNGYKHNLDSLFSQSRDLETEIQNQLAELKFN
jgi:type I restriction enzyme M protein